MARKRTKKEISRIESFMSKGGILWSLLKASEPSLKDMSQTDYYFRQLEGFIVFRDKEDFVHNPLYGIEAIEHEDCIFFFINDFDIREMVPISMVVEKIANMLMIQSMQTMYQYTGGGFIPLDETIPPENCLFILSKPIEDRKFGINLKDNLKLVEFTKKKKYLQNNVIRYNFSDPVFLDFDIDVVKKAMSGKNV